MALNNASEYGIDWNPCVDFFLDYPVERWPACRIGIHSSYVCVYVLKVTKEILSRNKEKRNLNNKDQ